MTEITAQNEYDFWRNALAGNRAPCNGDSERHSGRYRLRNKNKKTGEITYRPVAFWRDWTATPPRVLCKVGDQMIEDELRACEIWTYVAASPITNDVYKRAVATGEWPDVHPAVAADRRNSANAPDPDSLEDVTERVNDLIRDAEKTIAKGAATSDDEYKSAETLADLLRDLEVKADERRKATIEPHRAEIKRIDGLWNPLRDRAAEAKARIKKFVMTPFLQARQAQAAKIREQVQKTGTETPAAAVALDKAERSIGKAALREYKSAMIEDYQAALTYFADNAKVRDLIQQLANAAVRNGTVPAGCKLHTEQRAA